MHLVTILAFACVYWRAESKPSWTLVPADDWVMTLLGVAALPLTMLVTAAWVSRRGLRILKATPTAIDQVQHFQHRASMVLRGATVAWFAAIVFLTNWAGWFAMEPRYAWFQVGGDLVVLSPFVAAVIGTWVMTHPLENAAQAAGLGDGADDESDHGPGWPMRAYLDFHIRHYLLVVSVPMMVILMAANITRAHEADIVAWTRFSLAPDALLGLVAGCMFIFAPLMLRRIWRTSPLDQGPLRQRLEALCDRIGLRCREILIWKSDGMMINAAVMGLFAPVRYVMLSDALLSSMDDRQVEAVFGHEAGHIRRKHIQHFLIFALVGWFVVAATMELVARVAIAVEATPQNATIIVQWVGLGATILFWGVGFGWLSRRFERQADLFGARCVMPARPDPQSERNTGDAGCRVPCSVHIDENITEDHPDRVCATGASIFASALDRVALLNGIPHEERSWRHSSIASRIRFLNALAGDPGRAVRFEAMIRRVKVAMMIVAVAGSIATVLYWINVGQPAVLTLQGSS